MLPGRLHTKAVLYKLVKFPKLTVLNLTKLTSWEAGSIEENIVKVLNGLGNFDIASYRPARKQRSCTSKSFAIRCNIGISSVIHYLNGNFNDTAI